MEIEDLSTSAPNTWCPGCTNNFILLAVKKVLTELVNQERVNVKDCVIVTGIGCHAKIYNYLNLSSFYSIHGRVLPTALGIKLGNPGLTVIGFGGDGDTYAEGLSHFVHACRYNADFAMLVHNNQVLALTTGQATPTSEKGFKDKSTPLGVAEKPVNPIMLALVSGCTFVARGYALEAEHLAKLIMEAILHKGFGFVDILQPCITFHNAIPYFQKHVYKLEEAGHNPSSYEKALERAAEWDYCFTDGKVPIGIFYKTSRPTYEQQWPQLKPWHKLKRKVSWKDILKV